MADQEPQFLVTSHVPFMRCLFHLTQLPEPSEQSVHNLWTIILNVIFEHEHFFVARKSLTTTGDTIPDGAIFEVRAVFQDPERLGAIAEKQIFMLELKRPSLDTEPEWATRAPAQLQQYVETNSSADCKRMLGAVAIGTKVAFYRWDAPSRQNGHGTLTKLSETLDLTKKEGRKFAEEWLLYVKRNG